MIIVLFVALLFAGMGLWATLFPSQFLAHFGSRVEGRDGRSEVRAVYGGFGFAMAGALALSLYAGTYRPGILLCLALALAGMAAGRLLSSMIDREISPKMVVVLVGEAIGAALLFAAV
ncbi:MAG: DUF4345 family protein [Candidatus Hydrogenedentes bacterium]|nr:DUF4345 family protein [Candidatus Hydrogenedentota bacterium]